MAVSTSPCQEGWWSWGGFGDDVEGDDDDAGDDDDDDGDDGGREGGAVEERGGRQKGTCVSEGDHFRALQFGGVLPSPCGRRVGPLMLSPPPPTTEVVVFSPISPRVGGGWFYTTSPSIGVVGFFRQPQHGVVAFALPAPAWGGGALLCQTRQTLHQPQYGGRFVFFSRQPQHGVVVFALLAPAWGGAALLCQTRQTVHQPQYGGRLVFFPPAPAWGGGALLCQTRQTAIGVAGVRSSRCALAATREGVEHPPNLRHTSRCQAPRWGGTRLAG